MIASDKILTNTQNDLLINLCEHSMCDEKLNLVKLYKKHLNELTYFDQKQIEKYTY